MQFTCRQRLPIPPAAFCDQIFDTRSWTDWRGFGPIPGIAEANKVPPPGSPESRLGTRFEVTNDDGSTHTEEVIEYEEGRRLVMRMQGFSPPLSHLARQIVETWEFEAVGDATWVARSFRLEPRNALTAPVLLLIAGFLKAATARHLKAMAASGHR